MYIRKVNIGINSYDSNCQKHLRYAKPEHANQRQQQQKTQKVAAPKAKKAAAPKRPSARGLITPQRYLQDIKQRWAIHEYEINALVSDLLKGYSIAKPYAQQLVNQFK